MTKQVYEDLKELEAIYKKLTCSIQQAFISAELKSELTELKPVIHAKWKRGYSFPDGEYWKCSHCNELIKVKIPMHYCNNCGAKMESEEIKK